MKILRMGYLMSCLLILALSACSLGAPEAPPSTETPPPVDTLTPTSTPRPSPTPRPTKTPNVVATQRIEAIHNNVQGYFDEGYLNSVNGKLTEIDDFSYDWAQLNYYNWLPLNKNIDNFLLSAHFKWTSAYRNADISGCGIAFAIQNNGDHYAVFLDRSKIVFLNADRSASNYSRFVGLTRGNGRVKFDNPADHPVEADFVLIINGTSAIVLVDDALVGEYSLSKSKPLKGDVGLSLLSGTNKDFGTRCEMTDVYLWVISP